MWRLKNLPDEELLARCAADNQTEEAQAAARKEARLRGLNPIDPSPVVEESETYLGDRVIVARYLTPTAVSYTHLASPKPSVVPSNPVLEKSTPQ